MGMRLTWRICQMGALLFTLCALAAEPNVETFFQAEADRMRAYLLSQKDSEESVEHARTLLRELRLRFHEYLPHDLERPARRRRAQEFVNSFGEGNPLFDLVWLVCEPALVTPGSTEPLMLSVERGTISPDASWLAETELAICEAQCRSFSADDAKRHRYHRGVAWLGQVFGSDPWARYAARNRRLSIGLVSVMPGHAPFYGRQVMVMGHVVSVPSVGDLTQARGVRDAYRELARRVNRAGWAQYEVVEGEYRWVLRAPQESRPPRGVPGPPRWPIPRRPFVDGPEVPDELRMAAEISGDRLFDDLGLQTVRKPAPGKWQFDPERDINGRPF